MLVTSCLKFMHLDNDRSVQEQYIAVIIRDTKYL